MAENIFLIGFMGTGKTTVSRKLKELLGFSELDIDKEIEKRLKMTVKDIFEIEGEARFRSLETEVIKEISQKSDYVISCGGGAVLRKENVENMKSCGVVVLLCASPGTILERVKYGKNRPLLNGHMEVNYIAQMMKKRETAYEAAADIKVQTDGKRPMAIAEEIIEILKIL